MAETKFNFEEDGESFGESLKLNEMYYNCSKCPSPIEIISINEDESTIEFKCINNNHKIKMIIKEYINKMKSFNNKDINDNICNIHNKINKCYCLYCKKHICEECLKSRVHINHNKKILLEFQPNEKELKEIMNNFRYYENKIENLLKEKLAKIKELKDIINIEKEKSENNNNYDIKIENIKNLKRLKEIIYNTYNMYNNNYFNSLNVNKILIHKDKNDNINKINNKVNKININKILENEKQSFIIP